MRKGLIFLSLFILFNNGCASLGSSLACSMFGNFGGDVINEGLSWKEGEAQKYYNYNHEIVYRAVKRALKDLEIPIIKDQKSSNGYYLLAQSKDKFKIKIEKVEKNITRLSVRVNFMGDKQYALLFYNKVNNEVEVIEYNENGEVR